MKEKLINFLRNFEERHITVIDLATQLSVKVEDLEKTLLDLSDIPELDWFYLKCHYYQDGIKLSDSVSSWSLRDAERKPMVLVNRYYKDKNLAANIYLNQVLLGEKVYKGLVDESDIGGLYTNCYTLYGEYGSRINDYLSYPLEGLLSLFKEDFVISNKGSELSVSIPSRNLSHSSDSFFESFIEVIKGLSQKEEFHVVQVRESFEGEEGDAFDYSPVFYSKQEAEEWIKNKEESSSLVYSIVRTNI